MTEAVEPVTAEIVTETVEAVMAGIAEEAVTVNAEPALEETETETAEPAALAGIVTETVVQAALAEGPEVVLPVPDSGIPVLRALIPRFSQSPPAAVRTTTIITKTNVMIKRM